MLKAMQDQLIMGQVGAISSVNSRKQDIIKYVEAAQKGNLAVIKEHLEKNPTWVFNHILVLYTDESLTLNLLTKYR